MPSILSLRTCVVDPNTFFLDLDSDPHIFSDSVSDSNPYPNILARNFLKLCLSLLSEAFWNLYDRDKSFPNEKRTFFYLSSV
jgi:hypothetical protein